MSNTYIASPEGQLLFMALAKPVMNTYKNKPEYTCRILFDGNTTEGKTFRDQITAINPASVVTTSKTVEIPAGHFVVKASSTYQPKVVDYNKEELETIPQFSKGSTGTGKMVVKPFEGTKGGSINLVAVALGELNLTESTGNALDQTLEDALKNVNK